MRKELIYCDLCGRELEAGECHTSAEIAIAAAGTLRCGYRRSFKDLCFTCEESIERAINSRQDVHRERCKEG